MTWSPTSPVTGGTMSQFTTPTYTISPDTAPAINGKQHAVTALGGTQTGVRVHAVSDPFTVAMFRPLNPAVLPSPNAVTGKYPSIPKNTYGLVIRKGVNYAANNAPAVMIGRWSVDVPAGADAYDSANVRAFVSFAAGIIAQQSQGLGDLFCNGIL
jgi:hypothetical protein